MQFYSPVKYPLLAIILSKDGCIYIVTRRKLVTISVQELNDFANSGYFIEGIKILSPPTIRWHK